MTFPKLVQLSRYVVEAFFVLCDGWAFLVLPSSFARFPGMYAVGLDTGAYERRLRLVALAGCVLLLAGVFAGRIAELRLVGRGFRALGLGCSGMLWVALGATFLWAGWPALSGVPDVLTGVMAWALVLRGASVPLRAS